MIGSKREGLGKPEVLSGTKETLDKHIRQGGPGNQTGENGTASDTLGQSQTANWPFGTAPETHLGWVLRLQDLLEA